MKNLIINYIVEFLLGVVATALLARLRKQKKESNSMKDGMLSLLRAELIRSGEKYIERGYAPIYAVDAYDKAYIAYHGLGGNGTMTQLHDKVMKLPTQDDTNNKEELR